MRFKIKGTFVYLIALVLVVFGAGAVSAVELDGVSDSITASNLVINNVNGVGFDDAMVSDYSYVVYRDGVLFKAKNGETGKVDFSGPDRYSVIGDAVNNSEDGTVYVKSVWLDYSRVKPLIEQNVTIIQDHKGVKNYYSYFGHLSGTPGITEDRPVLRFFALSNTSKPIIEWRDQDNNKIAWIVAHEKLFEDDIYKDHKHISIETPKADMNTVITRFLVTYGEDTSEVKVVNADFYVQNSGVIFDNDVGRDTKMWLNANDDLRISTGGSTRIQVTNDEIALKRRVVPGVDGAYSLGEDGERWNHVYAYEGHFSENFVYPTDQPSTPSVGSAYFSTDDYTVRVYDGSAWRYTNGTLV